MATSLTLANLLLVSLVAAQQQDIWFSSLSTEESLLEWSGRENAGMIREDGSSLCPDGSTCYVGRGYTEIYRYDSTEGFHSVQLELYVQTEGDVSCQVWYTAGATSSDWSEWTLLRNITEPSAAVVTITFPDDADNEEVVGIDFYAHGNPETAFCRLDCIPFLWDSEYCLCALFRAQNFRMTGIATTDAPTTSPTASVSNEDVEDNDDGGDVEDILIAVGVITVLLLCSGRAPCCKCREREALENTDNANHRR